MKDVKGYVAQAGANKFGFFEISVGVGGKKFEKVGFGVKAATHSLDGVEIAKGMEFEGVVDETQYNKFVSGKVFKKEKTLADNPNKGSTTGGKSGGYDTVGNAVGGATNRVAQLLSTKVLKAKDAGPAVLAQYMLSEMCIEAVKVGKVKECRVALTDVDVNDYDAMAAAYKAFKAAVKASTPVVPQEATTTPAEPQKAPVEPAKAPVKQEAPSAKAQAASPALPEGFMSQEASEDDLPF